MKKVIHIITGLETGGAEMMLYKVLSVSSCDGVVICLNGGEQAPLAKKIIGIGVKIYFLKMKSSPLKINSIVTLWQAFRVEKPDVIQGWMYHGNVIATLIGMFVRRTPVLWNVRHSLHDINKEKFSMRQVIRLNAFFSKMPDLILYNSSAAAKQHTAFGFSQNKMRVIPNGFDETLFTPDINKREAIREQYGVEKDEYLLGLVARYHPMKGHAVFLQAIGNLVQQSIKLKVMLIGKNLDSNNKPLVQQINQLGLPEQVILLGERDDVADLVLSFDIAVSASLWGEGFANTIGEAMLSAVPCVVTDVGDSKWIVGEFGKVVPPHDVQALAQACVEIINLGEDQRHQLGESARRRIRDNFGIKAITKEYDDIYQSIEVL